VQSRSRKLRGEWKVVIVERAGRARRGGGKRSRSRSREKRMKLNQMVWEIGKVRRHHFLLSRWAYPVDA
jgi:hypothetical protein